jgi:hypothetical protein
MLCVVNPLLPHHAMFMHARSRTLGLCVAASHGCKQEVLRPNIEREKCTAERDFRFQEWEESSQQSVFYVSSKA